MAPGGHAGETVDGVWMPRLHSWETKDPYKIHTSTKVSKDHTGNN